MEQARRILKSVSMDVDLAVWLEEEARRQNRSVANLIETILIRRRETQGLVAPPEKQEVAA